MNFKSLDSKGALVIPKKIRENLGLTEKDILKVGIEGDRIVISKVVVETK